METAAAAAAAKKAVVVNPVRNEILKGLNLTSLPSLSSTGRLVRQAQRPAVVESSSTESLGDSSSDDDSDSDSSSSDSASDRGKTGTSKSRTTSEQPVKKARTESTPSPSTLAASAPAASVSAAAPVSSTAPASTSASVSKDKPVKSAPKPLEYPQKVVVALARVQRAANTVVTGSFSKFKREGWEMFREKTQLQHLSGQRWIGCAVRKYFEGHGYYNGVIVGFLPPSIKKGVMEEAYWKVVFEDEDTEDLDLDEVKLFTGKFRNAFGMDARLIPQLSSVSRMSYELPAGPESDDQPQEDHDGDGDGGESKQSSEKDSSHNMSTDTIDLCDDSEDETVSSVYRSKASSSASASSSAATAAATVKATVPLRAQKREPVSEPVSAPEQKHRRKNEDSDDESISDALRGKKSSSLSSSTATPAAKVTSPARKRAALSQPVPTAREQTQRRNVVVIDDSDSESDSDSDSDDIYAESSSDSDSDVENTSAAAVVLDDDGDDANAEARKLLLERKKLNEDLYDKREEYFREIAAMKLPANPLDLLIDELGGPHKVWRYLRSMYDDNGDPDIGLRSGC